MGLRSAIVLVFDRLGAGFLGPYGCIWVETPAANELAAQSLLCENALADSPELADACAAYWFGRHAMFPAAEGTKPWPALAAARGMATHLVTDAAEVAERGRAAGFAEVTVVPLAACSAAAGAAEETQLARLMAAALAVLDRESGPLLLWIQATAMNGPWDAPREFRERYLGEGDPPPPEFVTPPSRFLSSAADPDELYGLAVAYAAQVTLADMTIGALSDAIAADSRANEMLFLMTSPRGYPLGEHGVVGDAAAIAQAELLHVPLLVRCPQESSPLRSPALVQSADVAATLAEWLQLPWPGGDVGATAGGATGWGQSLLGLFQSAEGKRDRAAAQCADERMLRTRAWMYCDPGPSGKESAERPRRLYAKPDDYWEVNNVADRCGRVVEEMVAALAEIQRAGTGGGETKLSPLSRILAEGMD